MATKKKAKVKPRQKAGTSKEATEQRRVLFIDAYIANGENATDAAIKAGFSPKTAYSAGARLLKVVEVAAALEQRRAALREKSGLSVERTLKEVARLAYADIRKLYNEDGTLKLPHELDDDAAAMVSAFEVDELFDGRGDAREMIGYTKKAKLHDKNAALEKAMKFHGLYEKDNEQAGTAVARAFLIPAKNRGSA